MTTPLRGGYKWRRGGNDSGLENFGKRNTRVEKKNTSRISREGLGYIVFTTTELGSRELRAKTTI